MYCFGDFGFFCVFPVFFIFFRNILIFVEMVNDIQKLNILSCFHKSTYKYVIHQIKDLGDHVNLWLVLTETYQRV